MITQKQYVDRLEKMLKLEKPCATCPGFSRFMDHEREPKVLSDWGNDDGMMFIEICRMCMDFVNLPENPRCPCWATYPKRAIRLAHKAVAAYRNGTHRWCKKEEA
jgi:hypothetical protein